MQLRMLAILTLLYHLVPALAVDTNGVPKHSDAELQAAAQDALLRLIVYGGLTLLGKLVLAGFAFYGAYKALGVKGIIGISVVIAFLCFVVGSLLIEAF